MFDKLDTQSRTPTGGQAKKKRKSMHAKSSARARRALGGTDRRAKNNRSAVKKNCYNRKEKLGAGSLGILRCKEKAKQSSQNAKGLALPRAKREKKI